MDWINLLQTLGIFTIISTSASLLIGYFINRKYKSYEFELDKKVKEFESQLSFALESHKTTLEQLYYKTSKLHDKRIEIISELYSKISELQNVNFDLVTCLSIDSKKINVPTNERINELIIKADTILTECRNFFFKNKIYFRQEICSLIFNLFESYTSSHIRCIIAGAFNEIPKEKEKFAKAAREFIDVIIPPVLEQLEKDFRDIVGVEK
ncbi:MAG: hypothetical protein WC868_10310 [Bacteroidales bacterium]